MENAHSSQGSRLQKRGGTSPTFTWTDIVGITDIDEDPGETEDLEKSDLLSDAMEYEPGLPDTGTIKLSINWDPANTGHQALETARRTREIATYRMFDPDYPLVESGSQTGAVQQFTGYVKSFTRKRAVNAIRTGEVTFKITEPLPAATTGSITVT